MMKKCDKNIILLLLLILSYYYLDYCSVWRLFCDEECVNRVKCEFKELYSRMYNNKKTSNEYIVRNSWSNVNSFRTGNAIFIWKIVLLVRDDTLVLNDETSTLYSNFSMTVSIISEQLNKSKNKLLKVLAILNKTLQDLR